MKRTPREISDSCISGSRMGSTKPSHCAGSIYRRRTGSRDRFRFPPWRIRSCKRRWGRGSDLVLPIQRGRGKGEERIGQAVCPLWTDASPGEDAAGGIWAASHREGKAAGKETCHVWFPRGHAHLRNPPKKRIY